MAQWLEKLQEFDFTVIHRPDKMMLMLWLHNHLSISCSALPVDLMYHKAPESEDPAMYAAQLEYALVEA